MANRRSFGQLGVLGIILASTMGLCAAGPRLILVDGPLLERPVVLENWEDNMRFMVAVANPADVAPGTLTNRRFYRFALFWGPEWAQYVNEGGSVAALRSEQANQHARFYPATGAAPAVFAIESQPGPTRTEALLRTVDQQGLDLLAQHGLRVRIEP